MNDYADPPAPEDDGAVNPYSLLQAVNNSSDTAHTAWLIFIGVMTYLMIAVAGVTHKDLLLAKGIDLPILQVSIDLTRFFLFAPFVVVLFHIGVVAQLVMLARKSLELHHAISLIEPTDRRTHPLRLELHNFFFVQAIAGPDRSQIMSAFLHGMSWLTLVVLPVVLILFIQIAFLPYHDVAITWAHRVALVADLLFMAMIGVFLMRPESSFVRAFVRTSFQHPIGFLVTLMVMGSVAIFSFLIATVPDEPLDRIARRVLPLAPEQGTRGYDRYAFGSLTAFLSSRADGRLLGLFERNLNVADIDFVADKDVVAGEPTLVLRGRDLRYGRFDRADLHQADLTGVRLDGASLVGTDLRGAVLRCADVEELLLSDDRAKAKCTSARMVNLTRAKLAGAQLAGIDLTGTLFDEADLTSAEIAHSRLTGASFYSARLDRANMTGGVAAEGANFATASLQGADLNGARLIGADLTSAALQGANLQHAHLYGAVLRDADLEGATLLRARLQGADFTGTRLRAADLREAAIWEAAPPAKSDQALADLSGLVTSPIGPDERRELEAAVARTGGSALGARLRQAVGRLMGEGVQPATFASERGWTVTGLPADDVAGGGYRARLSEALATSMCRIQWSNGSVASGIVRRAQHVEFNGEVKVLYERLRAAPCPTVADAKVLERLETAVELARAR